MGDAPLVVGGMEGAGERSSSPTPHEIVLRARLEGVLTGARRLDLHRSPSSSNSRPHSPSRLRSRTDQLQEQRPASVSGECLGGLLMSCPPSSSSSLGHRRRQSLQQHPTSYSPKATSISPDVRKRSSTSPPYATHSSTPKSKSKERAGVLRDEESEGANGARPATIMTPPPTPPSSRPKPLTPFHRNRSDPLCTSSSSFSPSASILSPYSSAAAAAKARGGRMSPAPGAVASRPSPRSLAYVPKLVHSKTSPPGALMTCNTTRSQSQFLQQQQQQLNQQQTPPESSSPSPEATSPPHSPCYTDVFSNSPSPSSAPCPRHHHHHLPGLALNDSNSSSSSSSASSEGHHSTSTFTSNSGDTPRFNARKASAHCRAMEGYVSFAAVEGLGSPPDGLDGDEDENECESGGGVKKGWISGLSMFMRGG